MLTTGDEAGCFHSQQNRTRHAHKINILVLRNAWFMTRLSTMLWIILLTASVLCNTKETVIMIVSLLVPNWNAGFCVSLSTRGLLGAQSSCVCVCVCVWGLGGGGRKEFKSLPRDNCLHYLAGTTEVVLWKIYSDLKRWVWLLYARTQCKVELHITCT